MSNIKFQLSLNKHPKDCEDYSLVSAKNIRVSDDFSCLQSEESIINHSTINNYLEENNYKIFGIIPCNKELVIFAGEESASSISILRYNEDDDLIVNLYNSSLSYYGGKFIGTFTYNINNELIIAFSEYDGTNDVPLKTINLGVWNGENTTSEELDFEDSKFPNNPAIRIPRIASFDYVPGASYKGWYYYFIRYKINSNDYTKWFPIGFPIFTTTLELKNIFKYGLNNGTRDEVRGEEVISDSFILNGISDYFASKNDISNESIKIKITAIDKRYKQFQIGFCCISKTYSKAFRTSDIDIPIVRLIGQQPSYEYTTDISNCLDYTINDLILNSYNYYNVKNVINYKNRLYISNYKENNLPVISQEDLNKIRLRLVKEDVELSDIKYKDLNSNIEAGTNLSIDYVRANPELYLESGHITLRTGDHVALDSSIDNCYIETEEGNKIYPTLDVTEEGSTKQFILTFKIGYDYYTCTLTLSGFNFVITDATAFDNDIPIGLKFQYINTNNSFKDRKIKSTLLPGEIYNFYIHFVNAYGESTPGYRIPNTVKFKVLSSDTEYFPIKINTNSYLLVEVNQNIFNLDGTIFSQESNGIANGSSVDYDSETNTYTFSDVDFTQENVQTIMQYLIADYNVYKVKDNLTWEDLFATELFENGNEGTFSYYENSNEDSLFKIPDTKFLYDSGTNTIKTNIFNLKYDLSNFDIPESYNGFYFSYEKFESQKKLDGILTKYDVFNQDSINSDYKRYNYENRNILDTVNFYSSQIDINGDNDLDYNLIKISNRASLIRSNFVLPYYINKIDLSTKYPINYNNVELPEDLNLYSHTYNRYPCIYCLIDDIELKTGGVFSDGKFGIGTSLVIKLAKDKTNNLISDFDYLIVHKKFLKASLIKINKNIYTNENKVLIKFTNVFYTNYGSQFNIRKGTIDEGFNGHITYQGTLVYNYNKFIMSAENAILTEQYRSYYRCPVYKGLYEKRLPEDRPPIAYVQQVCFSDIFYEAKSFKNEPENLFLNLEEIKDNEEQLMSFAANTIITPSNSIDLFQNLQPNQDKLNPKTYLAKNNSKTYITKFDKRIQRSNIISDESLANSWRTFPLEGYKDISENKGSITNLIGIGTTLLAHTEHSLFAFDGSNTLKTGDDNDVRLTLPDVFDIEYVEVFTSDLGVCGLQDKEAWVAGQFGYIFYDNDAHRFYKYAFKKIEIIDFDIVQFLNFGIPYEVRFAHDVERNRLLINLKIHYPNSDSRYTLSYNHQINKFISLHTYNFDKAVNTKIISYLINDNKIYCNAHDLNSINYKLQRRVFTDVDSLYGKYDNGISNSPSISIIVNTDYEVMKTIEFITYKLFKRASSYSKEDYNIVNEREVSKVPYSGYKLHIHNDMCDSGLIDVSVDSEYNKNIFNNYKKPWWEFGNWNFNYFRNKKKDKTLHDIMSRIYGNYFVIDIIFYDDNNPYNQKIEFENLTAQIIADQTV